MPRASWRGYLRLSLVSCPIYLSPATARTKPIRLHQVWRGALAEGGGDREDQVGGQDVPERPASRLTPDDVEDQAERLRPVTRISLRPHDPSTGEEVEKEEVVRGYEYERGQYVTFTPDELKALDLESSKVIDLETFVPRGEVDPVYFNSPYYLYPDGQMAAEAIRVIGAAMADVGVVGIGRLTMSRRERMVVVDPRGTGMVLITLRAAEEVRVPQGKSTYARCGIIMNVTPLEAGWSGKITLEIANASPAPVKVYAGEGICQFVFLRADEGCLVSYSDRAGKYQNQGMLTTAKV
jgi:DNA end-binding protein Ku